MRLNHIITYTNIKKKLKYNIITFYINNDNIQGMGLLLTFTPKQAIDLNPSKLLGVS